MTTPSNIPEIHIDSVQPLVADGNHNGFTDMCRFRGDFYLAYRANPTGHRILPDSRAVILRSHDGEHWRQVHTFGVPDRDIRDPHLLVFRDTLFAYCGSWLSGAAKAPDEVAIAHQLGYAVSSTDGDRWSEPIALEATRGYFVWRAGTFGDTAYLGGKGGVPRNMPREAWHEVFFESQDGLNFHMPAGYYQETEGAETAFLFEDDGEMLAVSRCMGKARICRARPPYRDWTRVDTDRFIGGPMLARWGSRYLVGGRKRIAPGTGRTVLSWLLNDQLIDVAELPSGGDTGYPGFVPISDTEGLLSYYASHEGSGTMDAPCHVYLARISVRNH